MTNPRLYVILLALAMVTKGQSFSSGSNSTDGDLVLATPGTVFFDPQTFNPPLNPSRDNIFQFRSIYIAKDVTVRLSARLLNSPVFWLAQGTVRGWSGR
jgi:hypothetical protein